MTYEQAQDYVTSLRALGWRLGIDRMRSFCAAADLDPVLGGSEGPQYIHVAGTNGKGSTTAYLQSMLVEQGFRTGAYFSPYVVDPRERVQFGREYIDYDSFAEITQELRPIAEEFRETAYGGISEFEFKTAVGLKYWQRMKCDWVALEVGLGGRLDATNVVTPRAGIIVSVGMDHMNILGGTLAAIASEKAGIIKPGVPTVVGQLPPEAMRAVEVIAAEKASPVWRFGHDVCWEDGRITTPCRTIEGIKPAIFGTMQGHNLALAVAALDAVGLRLDEDTIRCGAALASIPGRFQIRQVRGRTIVLDGAHNVDSAKVLRDSLRNYSPRENYTLITNMLQGHESRAFYRPLVSRVRNAHIVPIDFHRAVLPEQTVGVLTSLQVHAQAHDSLAKGVGAALAEDGPILVTGSFYLVGEVLQYLDTLEQQTLEQ